VPGGIVIKCLLIPLLIMVLVFPLRKGWQIDEVGRTGIVIFSLTAMVVVWKLVFLIGPELNDSKMRQDVY